MLKSFQRKTVMPDEGNKLFYNQHNDVDSPQKYDAETSVMTFRHSHKKGWLLLIWYFIFYFMVFFAIRIFSESSEYAFCRLRELTTPVLLFMVFLALSLLYQVRYSVTVLKDRIVIRGFMTQNILFSDLEHFFAVTESKANVADVIVVYLKSGKAIKFSYSALTNPKALHTVLVKRLKNGKHK